MDTTMILFLVVLVLLAIVVAAIAGLLIGRWRNRRMAASRPVAVPARPPHQPIMPDDPDHAFLCECVRARHHFLGALRLDQVQCGAVPASERGDLYFARIPEAERATCSRCARWQYDFYVVDQYLAPDDRSVGTGLCLYARVCSGCGQRQTVSEALARGALLTQDYALSVRVAGDVHRYLAQLQSTAAA